ncbi:MAG: aminotransferase class V-fold PLP-dependent enzyme [Cyclobacteriaceae bacterium]|nr:aminotransferase class V-fold PLP-dependent enzyme [Cyclobacteriaceae bacterium]
MITRRKLLKNLSSLPLVGSLFGTGLVTGAAALPTAPARDYFKELGVRTFINAAGTYTAMTGSLMPEAVSDAIKFATGDYVNLDELQDKVGERIAELVHCDYATVTTGAASAITFGLAGVLTGLDEGKVPQLPDLTGMKNQVIMQKSHEIGYAHALLNCGVELIFIETRKELENAINDNTAMLWFLNAHNFIGKIRDEEWVEVGKKYGIPTFNDCAADVPPVENLWKYTKMGFDLVCFSGGKGIRGPQSAGLLLGKRELIQAARLHAPPRGNTLGRGMKVNKEEILGMLVALEIYVTKNHQAEWKLWEGQIQMIHDAAASVKGVKPIKHVPDVANHVPSLKLRWDQDRVKITPDEMREALRRGHPSIETVGDKEYVGITTWMMQPGQERTVARRVKEILEGAKG